MYYIAPVIALALLITISELFRTFKANPLKAIFSLWGIGLIVLNIGAAVLVYLALRYGAQVPEGWRLSILVGVTFPALLRSRLTFMRPQIGQETAEDEKERYGAFTEKLYEMYSGFEQHCHSEIDRRIAIDRTQKAESLMVLHSSDVFVQRIRRHISAMSIPKNRTELEEQLEKYVALQDDDEKRYHLALLAIQLKCM